MAKGEDKKAKKESPKKNKKDSPKKEKKDSPKDKKSPKKGPKVVDGADEIIEKIFARKRYETMDAVFKRKSSLIVLLCNRLHIWETWNKLPVVTQMCNSNTTVETKEEEEEEERTLFEPALIEGVVYMNRKKLAPNESLYVEVTAEFKYHSKALVPPIPPRLELHHYCYRDYFRIFPMSFEREVLPTKFNQCLIQKCRDEYIGMDGYPFIFDLTRAPDSIFLNRPHYNLPDSGVFWKLRCYIAETEYSIPEPEREVSLNFWKYTYAPLIPNELPRPSNSIGYIRYQTKDDIGDLFLSAELQRDVYYHGEAIEVSLTIENNSSRHVVTSVTIFVEQTVRIYRDVRQDYSIRLGEVLLLPPEQGLPIQPKSKNFSKKVELTPRLDLLLYNVGVDGHMEREKKYFLAGSTIILKSIPLTPEEILEKEASQELLAKGVKGKGTAGKKGSPNKKGSPEKKGASPQKEAPGKKGTAKKEAPVKKGTPQKGSPDKKDNPSEKNELDGKENNEAKENEEQIVEVKKIPEKDILTNKHLNRTVQVAYDVVVRLNLETPSDGEAGNPQVRIPFVLTRETWYIDQWTIPDAWIDMAKRK